MASTKNAEKSLKNLEAGGEQLGRSFDGLKGLAKDLAESLAGAFTVRAVFNFAKDIVNNASALKDLGQQTHINVEELQQLSGAMSEFGVDTEELGKGLYKLSRGIAGGDASVARGLHLMGMSLKDVEGLQGKELFLKIEDGLATLQGGLRDTASADLFSGKLGAAMARASEGIRGAMATWEKLNHVASPESVDALDAYGEAISRASTSLHAFATDVMGRSAQMFNVITEALNKGAGGWDVWRAIMKDTAAQLIMTGTGTENMTSLLDELNQATVSSVRAQQKLAEQARALEVASGPLRDGMTAQLNLHGQVTAAVTAQTQAEKFMAALEADAAAEIEPTQLKNLEHLKEIGALTAQNAAAIGVNAAQFENYKAGLEAAKKAATELAAAQKEADTLAMTMYQGQIANLIALEAQRAKSYGTAGQIAMLDSLDKAERALAKSVYAQLNSETERMKVIVDSGKQHSAVMLQKMALEERLMAVTNTAITAELNAQTQRNAAYGLDAQGHLKVSSAAETLRLGLEALHLTKAEGITQSAQEQVLIDAYTQSLYDEAKAQDALNATIGAAPPPLATATKAAKEFFGTLVLGTTDLETLNKELSKFYDQFTGFGVPGPMGTPGPFGHPRIAGPVSRAGGGSVMAGGTYLVGERGPELFRPNASGSIVPNGGGSSQPIVVQLVVDGRVLAEVVQQHTTRSVMRNTKLSVT